ncbi:MAG TPA: 30S ribosomal protein S2 [Anaerolineales bacterium]|nr:30S ribosomal protein S2 [Anaerolineales bacterium]
MAVVSMKALLESGVHFGHRTNKWDPRMKPYIFTERNGIHIIDLQQTSKLLNQAYNLVRETVANGGTILFVGTKRQAQETIVDEANRCGMPYVSERWLGGTLTNWPTMHARIQEMVRLERMRDNGELEHLTKKEGLLIEREILRLQTRLEGLRSMKKRPDLIYIIDIGREDSAVKEANLLDIPIVALVDTNCNPRNIDYVIPSNDDAIRAIKLLVGKMADAVLEGKAMRKEEEDVEKARPSMDESEAAEKSARVIEADEEVDDEELLGEATLAKLNASREEEEKAEAASTEAEEDEAEADEPESDEDESGEVESDETDEEEDDSSESETDEEVDEDEESDLDEEDDEDELAETEKVRKTKKPKDDEDGDDEDEE